MESRLIVMRELKLDRRRLRLQGRGEDEDEDDEITIVGPSLVRAYSGSDTITRNRNLIE